MKSRHVTLALLTLAALSCDGGGPPARRADNDLESLSGTWGAPPDDTNPDHSGGYLSIHNRDASGRAEVQLFLNGHDCWHSGTVTWRKDMQRFEWKPWGGTCWFAAEPLGERLRVTAWCRPSQCDQTLVLERIAADRLVPPLGLPFTFCASHDVLRQALCRSRSLVASERSLGARFSLRALGRGPAAHDVAPGSRPFAQDLMAAVESCRARGGDAACVEEQVEAQAHALEVELERRRSAVAAEQVRSVHAEKNVENEFERRAWEGTWCQDNGDGSMKIELCTNHGCKLRGPCADAELRFTGPSSAYGYSKSAPGSDHSPRVNEEETRFYRMQSPALAEGFANYCRLDLVRSVGGIRLALSGPGCYEAFSAGNLCPGSVEHKVQGTYHRTQRRFCE